MEVFALELKLKEEGAATVQAATQKLNTELNKTSIAANNAAKSVQTAQLNASKGALAFGGMARSMAQTGSAASLMSGGIVEAGTHIATFLGPQGVLLMAVTGLVLSIRNAFKTIREDVKKEQQGIIDDTRRTAARLNAIAREMNATGALGLLRGGVGGVLGQQATAEDIRAAGLERAQTFLRGLEQQATRLKANTESLRFNRVERARFELQLNAITPALERYRAVVEEMQREEGALVVRGGELAAIQAQKNAAHNAEIRQTAERIAAIERERTAIQNRDRIRGITAGLPGGFGDVKPLVTAAQAAAANLQLEMRETFAEGIGNGITDGIAAGFERGFATGNIGEGFKALAGTMLSGLGSAMIQFGKASLVASTLMQKIRDSLAALSPKGAVVASLAMIAAGGALRGVAQSAFGGMGGGGGMAVTPTTPFGIPMTGAAMGPTQLIFGATSATTAAGMTPRQSMNVTLIGPNDPTAQRAMQELLRNANQRGTLG